MTALLLTALALALVLVLGQRRRGVHRRGLTSFPAPPPTPCTCSYDWWVTVVLTEAGPHQAPCAFAPGGKP